LSISKSVILDVIINPFFEIVNRKTTKNEIYFNTEVETMGFAENFNKICQKKGTTPTALLKTMGVATNKVTMWNNGALPKQEMLIRLAHALGCSVMDFFADDEYLNRVALSDRPQNVEFALDDDERDIVRLFRTLTRQQKHEFMAQAYLYEKEHLQEE
jgi:hypothetical protein